MRTRSIGSLAIVALAITSCGGGDGGDGGGGDGDGDDTPQGELANMMIDQFNERIDDGAEGVTIDEDCLREAVRGLSDDDAQKILDDPEGDPELSPEAETIAGDLIACIDIDDIDADG